jgi:lysophospholipase L1-like esterase
MGEVPEGFEGSESLRPFFDRLARSARDGTPVHVLQFGDSHTASDDWVDSMRQIYQEKFGFGGPGFALAGHPYKGYRRFDIHGENSPGWITQGTVGHQVDGLDGLSGVSLTALRPGETVSLTTAGEHLELYYLRYPGAGQFSVEVDGVPTQTLDTAGDIATGFYTVQPSPGTHTYTVRTLSSRPVRLFGWVSENTSGLTWETLGINGAQARMMLHWDEPLWKEQIQRRDPALVILAYGTNEALYPLWTAGDYRKELQGVVERFRKAVPNAALLLVGPPDCGRTPFPHLRDVIQIQREVAQQSGVAFWNWQVHMDSTGGRVMWVRAGLSQLDYTHLTGDGYKMLGKMLADEIDAQYRHYLNQPPDIALSGVLR